MIYERLPLELKRYVKRYVSLPERMGYGDYFERILGNIMRNVRDERGNARRLIMPHCFPFMENSFSQMDISPRYIFYQETWKSSKVHIRIRYSENVFTPYFNQYEYVIYIRNKEEKPIRLPFMNLLTIVEETEKSVILRWVSVQSLGYLDNYEYYIAWQINREISSVLRHFHHL